LLVAALGGSVNCVKLFLQQGADYSPQDKKDQTAFVLARKNHRISIVEAIQKFEQDFKNKPNKIIIRVCCGHQIEQEFCEACW